VDATVDGAANEAASGAANQTAKEELTDHRVSKFSLKLRGPAQNWESVQSKNMRDSASFAPARAGLSVSAGVEDVNV
jgi:hypothetical protein